MNTQLLSKKPNYVIAQTRLDKLRQTLHTIYKKSGETDQSLTAFKDQAANFHAYLQSNRIYKQLISGLDKLNRISLPYACCLVKTENCSFSIHKLARGMSIPRHAHPQKFSLLIVESGRLRLTHNKWGDTLDNMRNKSLPASYLHKGDTSSGLLVENNLHEIEVLSESAIFISIRIQYNKQEASSFAFSKFSRAVHVPLFCALLPMLLVYQASDAGEKSRYTTDNSGSYHYSHQILSSELASLYRQSHDYNRQVEAAQWYLKLARRGSVDAQYWLGVMYLDGNGITEDDDEALRWLDLAAKQGHQQAEKLLNHLIESDFDMEC